MVDDSTLEALRHSDQRAIRTVDSLTDEQWSEPSGLPGWSRAHVVAHLALNAEGFARALDAIQDGESRAIYDSNDARTAEIEQLATAGPSEIRDRYYAATTRLRHTFGSLTEEQWTHSVHRVPDAPAWPVEVLPRFRRREVEVHHADLGTAYTAHDWPADFTADLLDLLTGNHAKSDQTADFAISATDTDRTWAIGSDSPVVSGTASALAWWLIGRSAGEGLTSDSGPLPAIGPWA